MAIPCTHNTAGEAQYIAGYGFSVKELEMSLNPKLLSKALPLLDISLPDESRFMEVRDDARLKIIKSALADAGKTLLDLLLSVDALGLLTGEYIPGTNYGYLYVPMYLRWVCPYVGLSDEILCAYLTELVGQFVRPYHHKPKPQMLYTLWYWNQAGVLQVETDRYHNVAGFGFKYQEISDLLDVDKVQAASNESYSREVETGTLHQTFEDCDTYNDHANDANVIRDLVGPDYDRGMISVCTIASSKYIMFFPRISWSLFDGYPETEGEARQYFSHVFAPYRKDGVDPDKIGEVAHPIQMVYYSSTGSLSG